MKKNDFLLHLSEEDNKVISLASVLIGRSKQWILIEYGIMPTVERLKKEYPAIMDAVIKGEQKDGRRFNKRKRAD